MRFAGAPCCNMVLLNAARCHHLDRITIPGFCQSFLQQSPASTSSVKSSLRTSSHATECAETKPGRVNDQLRMFCRSENSTASTGAEQWIVKGSMTNLSQIGADFATSAFQPSTGLPRRQGCRNTTDAAIKHAFVTWPRLREQIFISEYCFARHGNGQAVCSGLRYDQRSHR